VKILLLEDNLSMQKATTRMLRHVCGNDVHLRVVDSCARAIELLQLEAFDLIVSDYEVLDGTADALLHWIREIRPNLLPRFVFFSGTSGLDRLHDKVIDKGNPADFIAQMRAFVEGLS
jgi:CheY-like chemotaxis protein